MNIKNYNFSYTDFFQKKIFYPKNIQELRRLLKKKHTIIGNLRSYGDSCIGNNNHISLKNFSNILNIRTNEKLVEVQAGLRLFQLLDFLAKKNFVVKCLPGCKFVSIGGMIANNIHGQLTKNNDFKNYIKSLKIIHKGKLITCSKDINKNIFNMTIGGRGLTGPIVSAVLRVQRLKSNKILQTNLIFNNFEKFDNNLNYVKNYEYSVIWLNFLNKNFSGIFFLGKHLNKIDIKSKTQNSIKLENFIIYIFSLFVYTKIFLKLFNFLFFIKNKLLRERIINLNEFYFPQNKILNWNKVFKKNGFLQFHFYMKKNQILKLISQLKTILKHNKIYSNFAIIKIHETKNTNLSNFSLSVDLPLKEKNNRLIKDLNYFVKKNNLIVNLSKDIILDQINLKTLRKNKIFNKKNFKFINKNTSSKLFQRLAS